MSDTVFPATALAQSIQEPVSRQAIVAKKGQLNLHAVLAQLVNTITLPLRLPEMLQLLTELVTQALDIDLCMRIQKLCPLDLEHMPDLLPLLMALKSYRLRAHQWRCDESLDD
ncbi:hypothetical protein [Dictyobacter formicarum]|uniref:Uncharacterized protein n=1 Tax=Dictyobacter formicarum TaxID=2778368 RepID=A0ABQ3VG02_9CHLR|nr:hypothetical protein [Dictyobacter formicarum]GHO85097.1 hypothetical protein KSZ_31030 [Dictyobacter formicarum]